MEIRRGEGQDLEALNDVYNHYVRSSHCTFDLDEVTIETRQEWFAAFGGRSRLIVAVEGDTFLGYARTRPFMERRAYETSVSSAVYIHHDHHGKGVGSRLYEALFDAISGEDLHRAYAGISVPNPGSFALHERFGFKQVAYFTEQGRKFGEYWDVAWFEKPL